MLMLKGLRFFLWLQHVYVDVFSKDVDPNIPLSISPDYKDAAQVGALYSNPNPSENLIQETRHS